MAAIINPNDIDALIKQGQSSQHRLGERMKKHK